MGAATELRAEAARQRLSGRQIAKRLGLSHSAVNKKLSGERRLTDDDIAAFCKVLNIPAWELMRRAEEANENENLHRGSSSAEAIERKQK